MPLTPTFNKHQNIYCTLIAKAVVVLMLFVSYAQLSAQSDTNTAQVDTLSLGADELFKIAREAAFNGNRTASRKYLNKVLEGSPTYSDVRVFLGRTYTWDDQYDNARRELGRVIEEDPSNTEAYSALADVEFYDDKPQIALDVVMAGLKRDGTDEELLYKKAKALVALERNEEASTVLNLMLERNPSNDDAKSLLQSIKASAIKNNIGGNYNTDIFDDVFDQAHYANLQYGRVTNMGSLFVRGNYSKRFGTTGYQGEVDFYPSISKRMYLYLNYGYATSSLFPNHRFGAELYSKLPKAFEGSIGFRYLLFSKSSHATLYTATLGKYYRNYWFSVRTFVTPNESGVSNSYIFQVRRYFADAENYVELSSGFGFSPDQRLQTVSNAEDGNIVNLRSRKIGAEYQRSFGIHWRATLSYQFQQQQFLFTSNDFIGINSISLTARYKF